MSSEIDTLKLELRPFIKRSVSTGAGNVAGTTLVDATLVEAATFWDDCWVLLRTGTYAGALRRVTASVPGTLTLDHTVGGQIVAAVQYVMFTQPAVNIRKALREELGDIDIAGGAPEKYIRKTRYINWVAGAITDLYYTFKLERFYNMRITDLTSPPGGTGIVETPAYTDPNRYWTKDGFTLPAGYLNYPACYGKSAIKYPLLKAYMKWPDLTPYDVGTVVWVGLEHGGAAEDGLIGFRLLRTAIGVSMYAAYGRAVNFINIDITAQLPADYTTVKHRYYIKVNVWGAEFWVMRPVPALRGFLVAVALDIPELRHEFTAPPYGLGICSTPVAKTLLPFIEIVFPKPSIADPTPSTLGLTVDLIPNEFRWTEGNPLPPRVYRLYDDGTNDLFAGLAIAAGSETSHPFPLLGYKNKTIYFKANQNGTLLIELMNTQFTWDTYNTEAQDQRVIADELFSFTIFGSAMLGRVTFTPDDYPCTIGDPAEVVLG